MWSNTYQNLYDRDKNIINQEEHNHGIPPWKGTIISGQKYVGCRSRSKCSSSEEWKAVPKEWSNHQYSVAANSIFKQNPESKETHYSNTEREVLGILNGL